jgi:hypothetical protein
MAFKQKIARKAVKTTAKHTAHGTLSKFKREPLRAGTLLVLGAVVGLFAGWVAGRSSGADSSPTPTFG